MPLGFGLLLRALHLGFVAREPVLTDFLLLDSVLFDRMAQSILGGDLLAGREPFAVGPLYAYLLAGLRWFFGDSNLSVFVVQALVGLGSVALVTLLARRVSTPRGACAAGVAFAAYAPAVMLETKILGETFAVLGALGSTYILCARAERRRWLSAAGGAFGAACLLRPDFLLFAPLGALWLGLPESWSFRSLHIKALLWRRAAAWLVPLLAVVSLATLRNCAVTGEPILISAQGGVSLYQGNNPRAEGTFSIPEGFSGDKAKQEAEARALAERAAGHRMTYRQVDAYWSGRALSYLAADPGESLALLGRKLRYFLSSAELSGEYTVLAGRCLAPSLHLALIPFGLFVAATVLGVPGAWARERRTTLLLLLFALSGLMTALLFFVSSRYRIAAAAHLAVFVGPGVEGAVRALGARARRDVARLVAAGAALVLSVVPWNEAERFQAAIELYNLGGEHYRRRDFKKAISYYLAALEVRPENWALRYNLAHTYAVSGDYRAAAKHMQKAVAIDPRSKQGVEYLARYREEAARAPGREEHVKAVCSL